MDGRFATTRWTVVLAAGRRGTRESEVALAFLCEAYWYPLYAYARRRGHAPEEAEDLTQGFFAILLEKGYVEAADRERGRFRTFLLTAFARFMAKERDRERALKRGGGRTPLPFGLGEAEGRYAREPWHDLTPEKIYERRWALTVIDRALADLRKRCAAEGNEALLERLKGFLTGTAQGGYAEAGSDLGLSEGAVKTAVHRLRGRFREALRAEIARTVDDPADVEEELGHLRRALESGGGEP
jgi:RNA polymerase sigma factor (sigma-70 family)